MVHYTLYISFNECMKFTHLNCRLKQFQCDWSLQLWVLLKQEHEKGLKIQAFLMLRALPSSHYVLGRSETETIIQRARPAVIYAIVYWSTCYRWFPGRNFFTKTVASCRRNSWGCLQRKDDIEQTCLPFKRTWSPPFGLFLTSKSLTCSL